MKEVHIYTKNKHWFEKVEKVDGEYIFFEVEVEQGSVSSQNVPVI